MNKTERNSSLELLRLFCIIGILCMHLCGSFSSSGNITTLLQLNAVNSLFNICVSIFILISGYFGIQRKPEKMFSLWCIVIFYSILSAVIPLLLGNTPDVVFLFKSLFPTITGKYWYFTTYFVLWIFSPYLNRIGEVLPRQQFKILLSLLILVFYIFPTFFYFEIIKDNGKGPVNMMIVYLIGRYLSQYPTSCSARSAFRKNAGLFSLSITGAFVLNLAATLVGERMFAPFARDNSFFHALWCSLLLPLFREKKFPLLLCQSAQQKHLCRLCLRSNSSQHHPGTFCHLVSGGKVVSVSRNTPSCGLPVSSLKLV